MVSIHRWHCDRIFDVARAAWPVLVDPGGRLAIQPSCAFVEALLQGCRNEAVSRPPYIVGEMVNNALDLIPCAVGSCVDCAV